MTPPRDRAARSPSSNQVPRYERARHRSHHLRAYPVRSTRAYRRIASARIAADPVICRRRGERMVMRSMSRGELLTRLGDC